MLTYVSGAAMSADPKPMYLTLLPYYEPFIRDVLKMFFTELLLVNSN
jgi:hypothetical protein